MSEGPVGTARPPRPPRAPGRRGPAAAPPGRPRPRLVFPGGLARDVAGGRRRRLQGFIGLRSASTIRENSNKNTLTV